MYFTTFLKHVGDMCNDLELRNKPCGWLPGAQSQQGQGKWQTQGQFLLPDTK